ncbi:MAG TPA: hypothetical protein VE913_04370 [Longimicrobium sp.]|nr:hypothetical protein [Longimicrobium sp.]
MEEGTGDFWSLVYEPFMDRELNRAEARGIVAEGLRRSHWSYKRALGVFGIAPDDYLKFTSVIHLE